MDPVAISLLALVVSALSLGWNVVNYVLTGHRVSLEMTFGATDGGRIISLPPESWTEDVFSQVRAQGLTSEVVVLTAKNNGRAAITIRSFDLDFDNGMKYSSGRLAPDGVLPYRLEPYADINWVTSMTEARDILRRLDLDRGTIKGGTLLATGKKIETDMWVTLFTERATQ